MVCEPEFEDKETECFEVGIASLNIKQVDWFIVTFRISVHLTTLVLKVLKDQQDLIGKQLPGTAHILQNSLNLFRCNIIVHVYSFSTRGWFSCRRSNRTFRNKFGSACCIEQFITSWTHPLIILAYAGFSHIVDSPFEHRRSSI